MSFRIAGAAACIAGIVAAVAEEARGGIVVASRYSEVWYHTVNLTDGDPPPTAQVVETDPHADFASTLAVGFDFITVTGAHNTASCHVSQSTSITATEVVSDNVQNASTTTDYNDPGIYTRSAFLLEFFVAEMLPVTLTGLIVGSSNPADVDFARVELTEDGGLLFSTTYSAFPYVGTLVPGRTYRLSAEAAGSAIINGQTASRATVEMIVPAPPALILPPLLWMCGTRRRRIVAER